MSGTGDPRQNVEDNIVHLRSGNWDALKPADPRLMRACWDEWGRQNADPPPAIADRLWGPGADERWRRWQRRQRLKPWDEALRAGPRFVIRPDQAAAHSGAAGRGEIGVAFVGVSHADDFEHIRHPARAVKMVRC